MYFSKNRELKITLLLVNIIVNTECQHSQNNAAGLLSVWISSYICKPVPQPFSRIFIHLIFINIKRLN